jgi:hypothetical protein
MEFFFNDVQPGGRYMIGVSTRRVRPVADVPCHTRSMLGDPSNRQLRPIGL